MSRERKPDAAPPQDRNNTPLPRETLPTDLQKLVDDDDTLLERLYEGT